MYITTSYFYGILCDQKCTLTIFWKKDLNQSLVRLRNDHCKFEYIILYIKCKGIVDTNEFVLFFFIKLIMIIYFRYFINANSPSFINQ